MRLAVIGATGRTGREIVSRALALGHDVSALARPGVALSTPPSRGSLVVVRGDIDDGGALRATLDKTDAVVMAIAQGLRLGSADLCRRGAASLLEVLEPESRLVAVSSYGAAETADATGYARMVRVAKPAVMRDKDAMEALIRASGTDWTIVRPARLNDSPGMGRYRVGADVRANLRSSIPRSDLAAYLVDATVSHRDSRAAVTITR